VPHGEGGFSGGGTIFGGGGFGSGSSEPPASSFDFIGRLLNLGIDPTSTRDLRALSNEHVIQALEREQGIRSGGAIPGTFGTGTTLSGTGSGAGILQPPPQTPPQQQGPPPSNTEIAVLLAIEIIRAIIQGKTPTPRFNVTNVFGAPPGSSLPQTGSLGGGVPGGPLGGSTVPMVPTFIGGSGFGGGFENILQQGLGLLGDIFGPGGNGGGNRPGALPGGAPLPFFGGQGPLGLPSGGQMGSALGGNCIVPSVGTSLRLPSRVDVPSPDGRTFVTFRNMGRPVLWSGDFAAAKRVKRIAGRAKRRGGR